MSFTSLVTRYAYARLTRQTQKRLIRVNQELCELYFCIKKIWFFSTEFSDGHGSSTCTSKKRTIIVNKRKRHIWFCLVAENWNKEKRQCGVVFFQPTHLYNFILLSLPLVVSTFHNENKSSTTLLNSPSLPTSNTIFNCKPNLLETIFLLS